VLDFLKSLKQIIIPKTARAKANASLKNLVVKKNKGKSKNVLEQ
jgi:hypothetical protein